MVFIKEEPDADPLMSSSTSAQEDGSSREKREKASSKSSSKSSPTSEISASDLSSVEISASERETTGNKRKRRMSSESIGGFAAIAGVQKTADDDDEVFRPAKNENPQLASEKSRNTDIAVSVPGR